MQRDAVLTVILNKSNFLFFWLKNREKKLKAPQRNKQTKPPKPKKPNLSGIK